MTSASTDGTVDELRGAVDRLAHEFSGVYARETVAECVHDSQARLGPLRIKSYEALLAYRYARQRLRASAVVDGLLDRSVPEVLIVCTHNANAFPKQLTPEFVAAADVVITMGCGDACPVLPGRRYVDWDLPDPADATTEELRDIRDEVARRVSLLLHELLDT